MTGSGAIRDRMLQSGSTFAEVDAPAMQTARAPTLTDRKDRIATKLIAYIERKMPGRAAVKARWTGSDPDYRLTATRKGAVLGTVSGTLAEIEARLDAGA
jgi:hypothetical protein